MILPYEGQTSGVAEPKSEVRAQQPVGVKTETVQPKAAVVAGERKIISPNAPVERKKFTQPGLKIVTKNIGIKSILDPPKNQQMENAEALLPDLAEPFSIGDLKAVWNSYAINLKREKKDSLYNTLMGSEPLLTSDYQITLEIANGAQAMDLEREKVNLLAHLRSSLKNYKISFSYKVSEKKQVIATDSKSTFEKLADDNPSLHKFRKLFNLDIDF